MLLPTYYHRFGKMYPRRLLYAIVVAAADGKEVAGLVSVRNRGQVLIYWYKDISLTLILSIMLCKRPQCIILLGCREVGYQHAGVVQTPWHFTADSKSICPPKQKDCDR